MELDFGLFGEQSGQILTDLLERAKRLQELDTLPLRDLDPQRTLVVSIDLNKGFAKKGALYSNRVGRLIEPTARFLKRCQERSIAVAAFSDRHTEKSPELYSYPAHCLEGTEEWELVDELAPYVAKTGYKNSTNALFSGEAREILDKGYEAFVVTGCLTDICIFQFAVGLKAALNEQNLGKSRVIVPLDLVDTFDAPGHNAMLCNVFFLSSMAESGVELFKTIE